MKYTPAQNACVPLPNVTAVILLTLAYGLMCMYALPAEIVPTYLAIIAGGSTLIVCEEAQRALLP